MGKTLKGGEKEFFKAITNKKHNATINVVRDDPDVFFGSYEKNGENTLDVGDVERLGASGNAGGRTEFDALAHETLEAFYSTSKNMTEKAAHNKVDSLFPGLAFYTSPSGRNMTMNTIGIHSDDKKSVVGWRGDFDVPGIPGRSERITFEYVTPIPVQNFTNPEGKGVRIVSVESVVE